jgi:predicted metal-dependent phosphoesterase TrpH
MGNERKINSDIDLHIHSNFSDGSYAPEEIINLVKERGVKAFSVTDHDTLDGSKILDRIEIPRGISFFKGVEFSCKHKEIDLHMLGYAFCLENKTINDLADKSRNFRKEKTERLAEYLREEHKIIIPEEDMEILRGSKSNVGKPNFANILIRMGYGKSVKEVIEKYLNDFKAFDLKVEAEEAIKAISGAVGFSSLAHPLIIMKDFKYGFDRIDKIVGELKEMGLDALEVYYGEHSERDKREFETIAKKYKLMMSGGSDFHGTNKPDIHIGDLGEGMNAYAYSRLCEFLYEMML